MTILQVHMNDEEEYGKNAFKFFVYDRGVSTVEYMEISKTFRQKATVF